MTIPASTLVSVNPGVVGTGGSPLALNGVILTQSLLMPTAGVKSFSSAVAVRDFFGPASDEYAMSQKYFLGFDNSTVKPGTLFFAPYAANDRAAWLQSGSLSGVTVDDLAALSGVLTMTVDGVSTTTTTINLSAATSYSDVASLIEAGFDGDLGLTVEWEPVTKTFKIYGSSVGAAATLSFATGTLSTPLKFTQATGAQLSQGADADTPSTAMDRIIAETQNWATFATLWEPDFAGKVLFADWTVAQNQRFAYVAWDTDIEAITNGSTDSFGYLLKANEYDGVIAVYNTVELAVFFLGAVASIDFSQTNGRITFAYKSQAGFTPTVTDAQIAANLLENGYSFYGSYATANDSFVFAQNGQMAGKWSWLDTYVNQIQLNAQLQLALLSTLAAAKSVPYNQDGYAILRAAMMDPIRAALNFGSIRTGITLSEAQKALLRQAAGRDIGSTLETQGYYLQILDPGAQARGLRQSPVINLWYTDGGSVHTINLASVAVL